MKTVKKYVQTPTEIEIINKLNEFVVGMFIIDIDEYEHFQNDIDKQINYTLGQIMFTDDCITLIKWLDTNDKNDSIYDIIYKSHIEEDDRYRYTIITKENAYAMVI